MHEGRGQEPRGGRWRPLAFGLVVALVAVVGLAALSGGAAAAAPSCAGDGTDFNGGDGSSTTPYEITTVQHLQCMNHTAHLDANFTLTADVDASETSTWNGGAGFAPVGEFGDGFTGSFDGQGHTISDITIDRGTEDDVGLFGVVDGGSVANVTLDNATVAGDSDVGGFVGDNDGTVTNASASGTVSGTSYVGGLVGRSTFGTVADSSASGAVSGGGTVGGLVGGDHGGTVTDSHATGTVSGGGTRVGGLVGVTSDGSVTDSYATGNVTGTDDVGGLVGIIDFSTSGGTVTNSYATGIVTGDQFVGGLVGENFGGTVTTSYATGTVSGNSDVGGLVGIGGGVTTSYWDVNTTNQTTSDGGTGLTTRQLTGDRADDNLDGFDFTATWTTVADSPGEDGYGVSYPVLQSNPQSPAPSSTLYAGGDGSESNPYVIADWYHLDSVRENLDANYTLATDLDSNTAGYDLVASATANGGDGFDPIGNDSSQFQFTGSFDGQGHTISALTVDRSADAYVGMIGYVGTGGSVENVTLDDATVTGSTYVGGLVGWNAGNVASSNATGTVNGTTRVGGLVGFNDGTVAEARSHGTVTGSGKAVGGLLGYNRNGDVSNSSTTATVNGTNANVGGFVGRNVGTISDSSAAGNVTGGQDVTDAQVGGFVGWNDGGSVTRSSATGDVNGSGNRVGGLVGENDDGSVTASYATGDVDGTGNRVGGLVGHSNIGSVTNSYATGSVSGSDFVGGLIGSTGSTTGTEFVSVTASYATGTVTGNSDVGGLVGRIQSAGTVTDSYWDVNTTGQPTSSDGTGLTTTQMQRFAPSVTMTGFDFDATWNLTSAYPRLQWEGVAAITVDSLDAANATFDEDVAGTVTVTAIESGVDAGQGVTVEVTATDGLGTLSIGDTAVTDANGEVTFAVNEPTPGDYTPAFAWQDDNTVSDTATVTVVDVTAPTADAGPNQTVDEDVQVDFDGSASTDNGVITDYDWDLDDGGATAPGAQPSHTFADPGTYIVELTVTDGGGNTDTDTVTITVEDVTAPTADASNSPTTGDEDTSIAFDGTASTDNVGVTGYEWDWTTDGVFDDTGSNPAHTYADPGTYTVTLRVTDAAGLTDTTTHSVTVADLTPPTADAGPNQTATEDTQVDFNASNSTDNGNIASYDWDLDDGNASTGETTNHTYADPGTYVVELTVTDGGGNTDTDTVTITVEDVTAPTADAGPNQTVDEDTVVSFDASATTDNGAIASLEWDFGDGATDTGTTTTHTYADPGTYTVTLTATDAAGNADTDTLVVTVNDTTAPTADAGPNRTVDEDTVVSFDGSSSTDNGVIDGYEWAFGDGTPNATGVTPTHTFAEPGTYTVTLTVTDGGGNDATDSLVVTVEDVTPPVGSAGPNRTVDEDTVVTFDGSSSTDNVGIDTFGWDFGDGNTSAGATASHTYPTPGTYTVTLTATDSAGNVDTDTLVVTVVDVTAPTADAGPNRTVDEDMAAAFNASNSTDNGAIDSYEWDFGDGSPNATSVTTTHTFADPGTYPVTLTVTDGGGNDATDSLVVTVNDTTAPTADAGSNRTAIEGTQVNFDGSGSTDNAGIVSYAWTFGDGANATGATPTHTYTQSGTYTVTLTVTDAAGHNATDALMVTVQSPSSGGSGPGGASGGGSDDGSEGSTSADRYTFVLENGEGGTVVDESVVRVKIDFIDANGSGTVTVEPSDARPDGADPLPNAAGLVFVDVTVPSVLTDAEATIQLTLVETVVGDADPAALVIYRYDDGGWTELQTTVVSTADDEIVIEATTTGFSLFAVGEAPQQPAPELTATRTPVDATPTPGSTATPMPDDATSTSEPGPTESTATPSTEGTTTASDGQPGFGVIVFLFAVLVVALLGRRRDA